MTILDKARKIISDIAFDIDDNYIKFFGEHDYADLNSLSEDISSVIEELKKRRNK
jgi:hypothetical protein